MSIKLNGSNSGSIEIDVPADAGLNTAITFPATSGEVIVSNTSGDVDLGPLTIDGAASDGSVNLDSSGRLLVGTSTSREFGLGSFGGTIESQLQIEGESTDESSFSLTRNANSAGSSRFFFGKSRGTTNGSNTIVQDDDKLGEIIFEGADGSKLVQAAAITAEADGTPGADDMPGRLVFSTTANSASSPTEAMRIDSSGVISTTAGSTPTSATFGIMLGRLGNPGLLENYRDGIATTTVCRFGGPLGDAFIKCDGDLENTNNRYTGISDIKLKENIVDAASQWADIKSLRVRNYNFKAETGFSTHTQIGLVAQEIESVSPGLVGETLNEDTGELTKNVAYSVLYMKAVKALQEAMERIETLEASNTALDARLTALEGGAS